MEGCRTIAIATLLIISFDDLTAVVPTVDHLSGGSTTVFQEGPNSFGMPLANISRINRRAHVVGNSFFNKNWVIAPASTTARDGLGPLFNARSCSGCHVRDGRGAPPEKGHVMTGLLFRLGIPGRDDHRGNLPDPTFGRQLAVRSIPGVEPEGDVLIARKTIQATMKDGSKYELQNPFYTLIPNKAYGLPDPQLMMSPRIAPSMVGMGLLEAVSEEEILSRSDPDDLDKDGISGRPNRVWNPELKMRQIGRFGWKANQPDLRQQTAEAFHEDIGITSSIHSSESYTKPEANLLAKIPNGGTPEIDEHILGRVVTYLQTLAPPAQRNYSKKKVAEGKILFHEIGCTSCHVPKMKTDEFAAIPELRNQVIHPYTDLLLHDMGKQLADNLPDFEATGSEWRTPPLWGIGLTRIVNGHTRFLHDGRARNLEEAILWHGGEGLNSKQSYTSLPADQRKKLLSFLNSL